MKNVLIIGANGQLGHALKDTYQALSESTINNVYYTDVVGDCDYLDCLDYELVKNYMIDNKITHVINCCAYTNVGKAEMDIELCFKLNEKVPSILIDVCQELDATLIHISSDYVYSGADFSGVPFTEDILNFKYRYFPKGVYGSSKLCGELCITESSYEKKFILRTSWLYYEGFDTAFPAKIIEKLNIGHQFNVVCDQIGTPTYAGDLSEAIFMLINDDRTEYGIYNFSNLGACSWYDFAKEIEYLYYYGNYSSEIKPLYYNDKIRPYYSVMNKSKFMNTFGYDIPYWKKSLEKYFAKLNHNE